MSESVTELPELIQASDAINLNIGTLNESFLERAQFTLHLAQQLKKPIVFDPVGCGATTLRKETAQAMIKHSNIVRGNASEIMALLDQGKMQGVETAHDAMEALAIATELSQKLKITIVISGATDVIVANGQHKTLTCGSPLMKSVTGMGCALNAVIAAFHAVETNTFQAAYYATAYYGICGQIAMKKTKSPGSFKVAFLDALFEGEINDREF